MSKTISQFFKVFFSGIYYSTRGPSATPAPGCSPLFNHCSPINAVYDPVARHYTKFGIGMAGMLGRWCPAPYIHPVFPYTIPPLHAIPPP